MNRTTRKEYKRFPLGFYHLCLDRLEGRVIFHSEEDYRMGMATIALSTLKFNVSVYAFELMPNHLHDIIYGTGNECMKVFAYIKRRLSERLIENGYPPLPADYGCVLKPIDCEDELRKQILYAVRNPYEKNFCSPGGHKWGSGYLYFNELADCIRGERVSSIQIRRLRTLTGTKDPLPPDWEIHPKLGVLPRCFVNVAQVERLFDTPKEYHTRLVKEYETMVKIGRELGEEVELTMNELRDLANTELRNTYPGRLFKDMTPDEKCRVAVRLNERLGLTSTQLAKALYISELTISQALRSKDYGVRRR